ncbi:MAG: hypothetical protein ACTHXT_10440 [Sphingobacterium sp.]
MRKTVLFLTAWCFAICSCTKEKTDYETEIDTVVPVYDEFEEAVRIPCEGYAIHIESLNGIFYTGYNEIHLKIVDSQTNKELPDADVTFLPIRTDKEGKHTSCPHQYDLTYDPANDHFSGYTVFTTESSTDGRWELYIRFTINKHTYTTKHSITVHEQINKNRNMTAFTGKDNEQYVIALVSPQRPQVGENELIAGIYKLNKPSDPGTGDFPDPARFIYKPVTGYTLQLDPRMPESSMGNHSSPNNEDLTQQNDGLYHGVVNYTMTGNWTLNFILLNDKGRILRGTEVPGDFTPGVEGVKSELHIDILF